VAVSEIGTGVPASGQTEALPFFFISHKPFTLKPLFTGITGTLAAPSITERDGRPHL